MRDLTRHAYRLAEDLQQSYSLLFYRESAGWLLEFEVNMCVFLGSTITTIAW